MYPYNIQRRTRYQNSEHTKKHNNIQLTHSEYAFYSHHTRVGLCALCCVVKALGSEYITFAMYSHLVWFFMHVSLYGAISATISYRFLPSISPLWAPFFPLDKTYWIKWNHEKMAHANKVMYTFCSGGASFGREIGRFDREREREMKLWDWIFSGVIYIE